MHQELERLRRATDGAIARRTRPRRRRTFAHGFLGAVPTTEVDGELWCLHVRFARHRRLTDREELVERYLSHARALARRYYRNDEPLEDLEQVALEGLLVALDRFDPERRRPFAAFATPTISGLLKHHFRDAGWAMRVPRRVHDLARPVREMTELLTQDLGRGPTAGEIADVLDVGTNDVLDALAAEQARRPTSIDAPMGDGTTTLSASLGEPDGAFDRAELRAALRDSLGMLDERDRLVLRLYFVDELTQSEIGHRIGVSQMQVSRLLSSSLRRLRARIPAD